MIARDDKYPYLVFRGCVWTNPSILLFGDRDYGVSLGGADLKEKLG